MIFHSSDKDEHNLKKKFLTIPISSADHLLGNISFSYDTFYFVVNDYINPIILRVLQTEGTLKDITLNGKTDALHRFIDKQQT